MTKEEKKKYLQSYLPKVRAAKCIEEEIEQLRMDKMLPSLIINDMPHETERKDLSDYMAKLDEVERKLVKARYEKINLYSKIFADIGKMENETEKELLTYRYLRGYTWEKIGQRMNYSIEQAHRIHNRALEHFEIDK